MSHIGGGHCRNIVGDTGAVLADHHTGFAGDSGIGVFHVSRCLLMAHGNKVYSGSGEKIQKIHISGAKNTADMIYAFFYKYFGHRFTWGHFGHRHAFLAG